MPLLSRAGEFEPCVLHSIVEGPSRLLDVIEIVNFNPVERDVV
jgi:hypothetical protein